MAANNDRWRDSLYRDDSERGWRDWNRSARDRDRGTWERTGDEVRSWFGDDDAERRRRMDEAREPYRGEPYRGDRYAADRPWSDRDRYASDRPRYGGWTSDAPSTETPPPYYADRYDRNNNSRADVYPAYRHGGAMGPFTGRGPRGYQRSDDRIREDVCDRLTYAPDVDASDIEVQVTNSEVVLRGTVNTREEKRRAEDLAEDIAGVRDVRNEIRVSQESGRGETQLNLTGANSTPSPIGDTPKSSRTRSR